MQTLLAVFICIVLYQEASGQGSPVYPDIFSGYFYHGALANPAYVPDDSKVSLAAYYKFKQGKYGGINSFMAEAEKTASAGNKNLNSFRLFFFNEREGPYISRPRAYFNYALEVNIAQDMSITSGVNIGFASVNFTAPSGSGNMSLPDGAAGLTLQYRQWTAGISFWQLFNAEGVAISNVLRLQRYEQVNLAYSGFLSPDWKFSSYLLFRHQKNYYNHCFLTLLLGYRELIQAGPVFRYRQGLAFFGVLQVDQDTNRFHLTFTYNSGAFSPAPYWNNSVELGLRYILLR